MNSNMKSSIIGTSENVRQIRDLIEKIAPNEPTTLVCGETGVGKELVVQALYEKSKRFGKPFVKVNCAAVPDTLLESEMFGYEQGAFTGAQKKRRGVFEQAQGGVLFLDEIGEMPLGVQPKLLHVLQSGDYTPLGSEESLKADVWVIAATNRDLWEDTLTGKFRQDLYYRLSTIKVVIEPLRRRPEDVLHLIHHYLQQFAKQLKGKDIQVPSAKSMERLVTYHWPGNVRELQNVLKRIIIFGDTEKAFEEMKAGVAQTHDPGDKQVKPSPLSSLARLICSDGCELLESGELSLREIKRQAAAHVEKQMISSTLARTGGNRAKASRVLKISYRGLLDKIESLNIELPA
jgi:two-component system response regulator AtoC